MYLLNRGYYTKINDELSIDGVVFSPSQLERPKIERRDKKYNKIRLFDPQLYFPIESKPNFKKTFTKLATYPWYNPEVEEFNSKEMKITDFLKNLSNNNSIDNVTYPTSEEDMARRIQSCIEFQLDLGCSHIILPTPLICDIEDGYTEQLRWINTGIKLINGINKPILVSVAFTKDVITQREFDQNTLLSIILDNLTSFTNIDGFYITFETNTENQICDENIITAILEFSYILGNLNNKEVFLNYVDLAGFLGLAVGCTAFASGYYAKEKLFNFEQYNDEPKFGTPLPRLLSYTLIGDLLSERDLTKLRNLNALHLIKNDITKFSTALYNTLEQGQDVSMLDDWKESKNNISTAQLHRSELLAKASKNISTMNTTEKLKYTLNWLTNADFYVNQINTLLGYNKLSENFNHIGIWKKCLIKFIEKYSLL
ncbi:hypothetical protein [Clostridium sp.]|uniref:hypothetical protein n=1 Tax=Clostridium sp. TaxID=1506 RepID=UPI0029004CE0|nr:hypothetical protein [Clostridium sp.]MDU1031898.1 hypothetical protein [Clostridium sp.]